MEVSCHITFAFIFFMQKTTLSIFHHFEIKLYSDMYCVHLSGPDHTFLCVGILCSDGRYMRQFCLSMHKEKIYIPRQIPTAKPIQKGECVSQQELN